MLKHTSEGQDLYSPPLYFVDHQSLRKVAIFFVYFLMLIGFSSIMNNNTTEKKHDCYVVLKDSTGLINYVYGFFLEDKTDYSGRKCRGMYIEGNLHYFPAADVIVNTSRRTRLPNMT